MLSASVKPGSYQRKLFDISVLIKSETVEQVTAVRMSLSNNRPYFLAPNIFKKIRAKVANLHRKNQCFL